MESIQVETSPTGQRILSIVESPEVTRMIPLDVIASHAELLGYDDPTEAIEALIHIQDHGDDSPEDMDEGEDNWATEAYILLQHREGEREKVAEDVMAGKEDNLQSKKLRSTLAAHRAVHEPIDGGECAMDRCRRAARGRLGVGEPSRKCGASSRVKSASTVDRDAVAADGEPESRRALRGAVSFDLNEVQRQRSKFLLELNGRHKDPIDESTPEPEPDVTDEVMRKYGGKRTMRAGKPHE